MWRASRRFRALCAAHLFLVRGDEALLLRRALTLTFHADHEVDRERDAGAGVWFESYGWRAWLSPPHHAWQRALHVRPGLRSAGVAQE